MIGIAPVLKSVAEIDADIRAAIAERQKRIIELQKEVEQLQAKLTTEKPPLAADLSQRERTVMRHVSNGASNKEIASFLGISETTVKAHLRAILSKLHVKNRAEAVCQFARIGSNTD